MCPGLDRNSWVPLVRGCVLCLVDSIDHRSPSMFQTVTYVQEGTCVPQSGPFLSRVFVSDSCTKVKRAGVWGRDAANSKATEATLRFRARSEVFARREVGLGTTHQRFLIELPLYDFFQKLLLTFYSGTPKLGCRFVVSL